MNPSKVNELGYINFLIGMQQVCRCTEAARVQPDQENGPAHDAINRLLHRLIPTSQRLWEDVKGEVDLTKGGLIADDSTLDKLYSKKIALVTRHWSGKHKRVVRGINLITLLWTVGECYIPVDYRIYNKTSDGLSKNDHLRDMLKVAYKRDFKPEYVTFDSWYASL